MSYQKAYFSHLFIKVKDLKTLKRLLEAIGLKLVYEDGKYFRFQGDNDFYIGVEEDKSATYSGSVEINIHIPNIENTYKKLKSLNISSLTKPKVMPWGVKHIFFVDQNGIKFSVWS